MTGPRIGELFAGYGGLGQGVRLVLGGEIAWFSEFDKAPSKILAHHWPLVPNHGDITLIDWSTVEPVDILTGGFPCQDVSLAGARRGLKDGTRSGLWSYFAEAIGALKPELVVIENVRGLLSADASSGVESCPECVGDGPDAVSLRALGAVLGDLADLGYDAEWAGVRAADAGAPHGRFRVFIVAYPRRSEWGQGDPGRRGVVREGSVQAERKEDAGGHWADSEAAQNADFVDANPAHVGHERGRSTRDRGAGSADSREFATDPSGKRLRQHPGEPSEEKAWTSSGHVADGARGWRADSDGREVATDTDDSGRIEHGRAESVRPELATPQHARNDSWGVYGPAIRRWEAVMGRVSPPPTLPDGKNGSHRLSARFVEWLMGLDDGHVTDVGLTRNEQLKALGNGVVPQQAEMALRVLLSRQRVAA